MGIASILSLVGGPIIRGIGSLFGGKTKDVTDKVADVVDAVQGKGPAEQQAAISETLAKMTPEELQAFEQAKAQIVQAHANIVAAQMRADADQVASVNATMQAESHSAHWIQWFWRPFTGFLFGPTILAVYVVLPILGVKVPEVPPIVWTMWGATIGITAWHRGVMQRVQAGDTATAGSALGTAVGKLVSALPGKG